MTRPLAVYPLVVFLCLALASAPAADLSYLGPVLNPYKARPVAPPDFTNSPRIGSLMRAGNLYLSLSDAIALAVENNLDVELLRYAIPIAETEVLRAQGGGLPRFIYYTIAQPPAGSAGRRAPCSPRPRRNPRRAPPSPPTRSNWACWPSRW